MAVTRISSTRLSEALTQQYYDWEHRGRGWMLWNGPVELEPPFRPFFLYAPSTVPVDDGQRETLGSSFVRWITGESVSKAQPQEPITVEEPVPEQDEYVGPIHEFKVSLPPDESIPKMLAEHLVLNLSYSEGPVAFEIIGTGNEVVVQLACRRNDSLQLKHQLKAHVPAAQVSEHEAFLETHWLDARECDTFLVDFGLSQEFSRPISCFKNFDIDPLIGVVGNLDNLNTREVGVFQVLFEPVRCPWAQHILYSVTDGLGGDFFADAPDMVPLAREKIAHPLFAIVVRIAAKSPVPGRALEIARGLGTGLLTFDDPASNELIPLNNDGYPDYLHEQDLLCRRSHRSGMILNSDELVGLAHLPSPTVRAERLSRKVTRTKAAPVAQRGELVLGKNTHNERTVDVSLTSDERMKHMYVIGASGTGKSTFLLNLITQDIEQGRGVAVLDPHGDLIDDVMARIPERRHDDVIVFDPADEEFPIGFNVLSTHSDLEKQLLASDFVSVFQRLATSWGDQMTTVLSNAVLAMLESERVGTLSDLRRFLVEKDFRREFLTTVQDRDVVYYWEREFPLLSGRPQGPILTRLDTFLRPKLIRHIVAQKENRLDMAAIMNEGKIFLAKLAQGAIGHENSYLLGTLLVSKFYQMTLARQELQAAERRPYHLVIDEAHNFVTPSLASILTGVRKYKLGLVLANQELRQIEAREREVASAVLSNPHTRVCFRVGDDDARKLADGFGFFEVNDLLNLGTGEAICRLERADRDFNLHVPLPDRIDHALAQTRAQSVVSKSRAKYATSRDQVVVEMDRQWESERTVEDAPEKRPPRRSKTVVKSSESTNALVPKPVSSSAPQERAVEPEPDLPVPDSRIIQHDPTLLGKGGLEHKHLQLLVKRFAEGFGYRATVEKPLGDGYSIDVALEKEKTRIACEISVSTAPLHELGNIRKCLEAGYDHVAILSTDPKKLASIKRLADEALSQKDRATVRLYAPDELFQFMEGLEATDASRERTVRGYKVKVRYGALNDEEKSARKRAISRLLFKTATGIHNKENKKSDSQADDFKNPI